MKQKHLHLLLGIGGIYLALLTIYLCLAAGVLLVSTLRSMIQMDMFDFQRWSLQNAMPLYIAMALSVLSGLAKLLSGVLGALCLFSPRPLKSVFSAWAWRSARCRRWKSCATGAGAVCRRSPSIIRPSPTSCASP